MQFMVKPKLAVDIHISLKLTPSMILVVQTFWVSLWTKHYPGKHVLTS